MRILCEERKRPGGKLVRICIKLENDVVNGLLITGDFFTDAEALDELNKELQSVRLPKDTVIEFVLKKIEEKGVSLIGIGPKEVEEAIKKALFKNVDG